jgi:hypothetical protein
MTSSDEGFRVLLGWKRRGAALHMELTCPCRAGATSESAQVVDVSDGWLTIQAGDGRSRDFHLRPGSSVVLLEANQQQYRDLFTKVVRISSTDKEELILAEPSRM